MENLPNHIAIIPDGNRRWAKSHNLPSLEGHRRGADTGIKMLRKIRDLGISTSTIWAFSTENWSRAREETGYLMDIFIMVFKNYIKEAVEAQARIIHLGRKDRLPRKLLEIIEKTEETTRNFTKHYLNLAIDYGGQDEVIRAIQKAQDSNTRITQENFSSFLDTKDQPHPSPDLVIRTSGEKRTSGLMIWQAAYAEYIFLDKYFPDMKEQDIDEAVEQYQRRQRRFGK